MFSTPQDQGRAQLEKYRPIKSVCVGVLNSIGNDASVKGVIVVFIIASVTSRLYLFPTFLRVTLIFEIHVRLNFGANE